MEIDVTEMTFCWLHTHTHSLLQDHQISSTQQMSLVAQPTSPGTTHSLKMRIKHNIRFRSAVHVVRRKYVTSHNGGTISRISATRPTTLLLSKCSTMIATLRAIMDQPTHSKHFQGHLPNLEMLPSCTMMNDNFWKFTGQFRSSPVVESQSMKYNGQIHHGEILVRMLMEMYWVQTWLIQG